MVASPLTEFYFVEPHLTDLRNAYSSHNAECLLAGVSQIRRYENSANGGGGSKQIYMHNNSD